MKCQECGKNKSLTYRSVVLGKTSVCAPCIRKNHLKTLDRKNWPRDQQTGMPLQVWEESTPAPQPE